MACVKSIRWTLELAASEFPINRTTLGKRLKQANIKPDADQRFSTKSICDAVFGNLAGERLRLVREQADRVALENAKERRELISVREIAPIINRAIAAIKAEIDSISYIERDDKDKILIKCGGLWDQSFNPVGTDQTDVEPAAAV